MAAGLKLFAIGLFGAVLAACQSPAPPASGAVYLVRHAEKVTNIEAMPGVDAADPPLSAAGEARADLLISELADAGISAVWSTDYARTRDTAAPIAAALGLAVQVYDPSDLPGFAAILKTEAQQSVLIVGHSNTTPTLAVELGGEAGPPIDEPEEYDRLYVVDLVTGETVIRRYGAPYTPDPDNG